MQCPVDGARLEMSERQGVEIDYCPTCRGVWLDRGELDKIVERSESYDRSFDRRPATYDDRRYEQPYRKKRKSFFSELFDD
jgi:Zn-finger nucleic acid-binding protein